MDENPLKVFEKLDPEFLRLVEDTSNIALPDGAMPKKLKLLLAVALDAAKGAVQGVKALAQAAMQAGATKEEIREALRVAQYISGVGSVYTAAQAIEEIL